MSSDKGDYEVQLTANPAAFEAGFKAAANAAKSNADLIKNTVGSLGSAFEDVLKPLKAVSAALAGGAFFKEAIGAALGLNGEVMNLGKRLGLTAEEAGTLRTALGDIYTDSDTYIGAFEKFAKQLKNNEEGLQAMGLKTRDANGNLRDSNTLFREALTTVSDYKPGLDQTTAAMTLFGKGVEDVMKLQKLNDGVLEDAAQKNKDLGLSLSQDGVNAAKAYKAAMNDVGDVFEAIKVTIGRAVMPMFTELSNYFASTGPAVIKVFKGALLGLGVAFDVVKGAVLTMAGVVFETFNTIMEAGAMWGEAISRLLHGDFSGAFDSGKQAGQRFVQGVKNAWGNFQDVGAAADASIKKRFDGFFDDVLGGQAGAPVKGPKTGTKTMGDFSKTNGGDKADKGDMPLYEERLAKERATAAEVDAIHGMSKEAELKFWQEILNASTLKQRDKIAVTKKVEEARLAVLKDSAQHAQEIDKITLQSWQERELAKVELEAESAKTRKDLGEITNAQLLEMEVQFEARRGEIKQAALRSSLATLDPDKDPVQVAQLHAQLEQAELAHQQRMAQIRGQVAVESGAYLRGVWQDLSDRMGGLWDKGIAAMMTGTLTWKGAFKAVGTELTGWFANAVVGDQVKTWVKGEAIKLSALLTGKAAEKSAVIGAAALTQSTKAIEGDVVIGTNAGEAASGAAAAMSSIPWVGPVLAAAAFASIFALVMGARSSVKSASAGFDIPSGMNPMTQLHEEEMVLPAHIANPMRDMLADGGAGRGGGDLNVSIRGASAGDFFMLHKSDFVKALKSARRDGVF